MPELKKLPAVFHATATGNEPVREWLKALDEEDRRTIGQEFATADFGWPVGMPLCRSLGKGPFENRSNISSRRIARVIFSVIDEHMVLLHGFVKKTQKTPKPDLQLAANRLKEIAT